MTASLRRYGPWADDLPDAERSAQFRELHALAYLIVGRAHPLVAALRDAANDAGCAEKVWHLLGAVPARQQRHVVCTLATLREAPR